MSYYADADEAYGIQPSSATSTGAVGLSTVAAAVSIKLNKE